MAKTSLSGLAEKGKSEIKKKLGLGKPTTVQKLKIGSYVVLLNPNQISHSFKVNYVKQETATGGKDTTGGDMNKASTGPESLSFDLMLDGTGATGTLMEVDVEVAAIATATYKELKDTKETKKLVEITWGKTIPHFTGFLETFDVSYSLFDKSGKPLRATVKLSFVGFSKLTEEKRKTSNKSTTEVEIGNDKTITNLCKAIYKTPAAYIAVAKSNKLTNVRKLKPGTKLVFPPKKG